MANNVVVFQGLEVTLPPEVSFSHRDGCLEIDMSHGFSGKLLLRKGGSVAVMPQACIVCSVPRSILSHLRDDDTCDLLQTQTASCAHRRAHNRCSI